MPNILVSVDRHLVLGRYLYGRADWFEVVCDDPCLLEIAHEMKRRCDPETWKRLLCCPLQLRHRLLGTLAGFAMWPNGDHWCPEHLLRMLLANETRPFPHIWIETNMVGTLAPVVKTHLPKVAKWVETFSANSRPLSLVIVRQQGGLLMRFERWTLRSPTERVEYVLAYRTQPEGVCTCCRRPAFWKLPRGMRGCSSFVVRLVGDQMAQAYWRAMLSLLASRKARNPFDIILVVDVIGRRIFEWCFCHPNCLGCSCNKCTEEQVRDGLMCPADAFYLGHERMCGHDSPRHTSEPLHLLDSSENWYADFDRSILKAVDEEHDFSLREG